MTRAKNTFAQRLRIVLLLLYLCLLIIHFIIKDRFRIGSVIYYACPLPLIIILGLMVTTLFFRHKKSFYALSAILLAISIYFFTHYFGSELRDTSSAKTSHLLFWNVAQAHPLPTDILIKHIHESNPEIVALVEALDVSDEDLNTLKSACPGYHFLTLKGEMLVAVRGSIDTIVFESKSDVYKYNHITAYIHQKPVSILIADVYASPLLNKEIPLNIIHQAAQKYKVDMILGDFNTPYESVFFDTFKNDFNSFHPYSIGMTSTWPTPIPVIEIDQIWIGKAFQPIKMQKYCYKISDHKVLIAEYQ